MMLHWVSFPLRGGRATLWDGACLGHDLPQWAPLRIFLNFILFICALLHNFVFNIVLPPVLGKAEGKSELDVQENHWGKYL